MIRIRLTGRISIRRQLIFGFALVHLLLMSIFVIDLTARQRSFLSESAKDRVLYQVNALATSSLPYVIADDTGGLTDIVDAFASDRTIRYAMVTDAKGRVLSHSAETELDRQLDDSRSLGVLRGAVQPQLFYESALTVQAAAPIRVKGHLVGWAWLGVDRSDDQRHLAYVTRAGLFYTLVAVLIGTIFAIALGNTITRSLRALLLGTKRLSEDQLDTPVPILTNNEVGVVARAFNNAMAKLARQRADLHNEIAERQRAEDALKKANEKLARSNRDLEQFAYAASHDLQEPLRSIKNFTALLERRYRGRLEDDAMEFIGYIVDGASRMQTLIRDLLAYSRAARYENEPVVVDTNTSFSEALENLRGAIENSHAKVTSSGLPQIVANDLEMVRLFQNLLSNAIKYRGDREPEIHVTASRNDGDWLFEVSDNGIGIPQREHERIFAVFARLHGRDVPGSGIGLATCVKIVEHLGGRIWVESEVGTGSTFKFTIKAVPAPTSSAAATITA